MRKIKNTVKKCSFKQLTTEETIVESHWQIDWSVTKIKKMVKTIASIE